MKKTLVVLTACMLAFGVAACGNDTTKETETEETTTTVETTVESEVDETEATEENIKDSKFHGDISDGDKDTIKDDGTLESIKDIIEDGHYDENGEQRRDEYVNEHGDTVKPGTDAGHSKVDGAKDTLDNDKPTREFVVDNETDENQKPAIPRKVESES